MTSDFIFEDPFAITQEQEVLLDDAQQRASLAFIADDSPMDGFALLTPGAVQSLVDKNISVYIQHGFAGKSQFSDMDYANAGAEFEDDLVRLSAMSKILVKFQPFSKQQLSVMREEQWIISSQQSVQMDLEYMESLKEKGITALALNFIKDHDGLVKTDRILTEIMSKSLRNWAMSAFLLPILEELATCPRLKFALQKNLALMQSVYCYNGHLCNREIADALHLPWKDINALCWELN